MCVLLCLLLPYFGGRLLNKLKGSLSVSKMGARKSLHHTANPLLLVIRRVQIAVYSHTALFLVQSGALVASVSRETLTPGQLLTGEN